MIAIDTNILIYAFDATDKKKHQIAKKLIEQIFLGERKGVITNQILAEFAYVATKKLDMPNDDVARIIRSIKISNHWEIHNYGTDEIDSALQYTKHFWDSLIATTLPPVKLYTENEKHFTHTKIETHNPFTNI